MSPRRFVFASAFWSLVLHSLLYSTGLTRLSGTKQSVITNSQLCRTHSSCAANPPIFKEQVVLHSRSRLLPWLVRDDEETRTRSSPNSGSDDFACDDHCPRKSPVTPRTVSVSSKCNFDGFLVAKSNNENGVPEQMYGHSCDLCGANFHIMCCQQIL